MSTLAIRAAADADRAAWDRFVAASPGAEAAHLWAYHDLLAGRFRVGVHRLIAHDGDRVTGLLPLIYQKSLVGRFLTSVPYLNYAGVLGGDADTRAALARAAGELADRLGAQRLEIRGRDGGDLPLPSWDGKCGYTLALADGNEEIWKRLRSKVRAQVRRPSKDGYTARHTGAEGTATFYRLLSRRWHELGSPVLPRAFFEDLARVYGDRLEYVFVEKGTALAAAGALLDWNGSVEIPWAASALEHNRFGVNMTLYWTAIGRAIERGAETFDFGRSTPDTGNAKFKLQWGAVERPLVWNVRTAGSSGTSAERGDGRRDLVARTWRRLPRFVTARLGPYLAARIPY